MKEIELDERFLRIPIYVAIDPRISAKAKLIYGLLNTRAFSESKNRQCFPSQETIAGNLALSVSAVKSAIEELMNYEYILKKQKLKNQGRHNIYTVYAQEDVHGKYFCEKRNWSEYDFVTSRAPKIAKSLKPLIDVLVKHQTNPYKNEHEIIKKYELRGSVD